MGTLKKYNGQYRKIGGKCSHKHNKLFYKWFDEAFNLKPL